MTKRKIRKRVTFTTEADTWARCHDMLKEKGYPLGAMGYYLTNCIHALEEQLRTESEELLVMSKLSTLMKE